jgi:hypothetical protein
LGIVSQDAGESQGGTQLYKYNCVFPLVFINAQNALEANRYSC